MLLMFRFIQHANDAQQAFSSSSTPSLQNALPALERMHVVWEKASNRPRYLSFVTALEAGMQKLDQYYKHSAESDAHIMSMGKSSFLDLALSRLLMYCTNHNIVAQSLTPRRRWRISQNIGQWILSKKLKISSVIT